MKEFRLFVYFFILFYLFFNIYELYLTNFKLINLIKLNETKWIEV